MTSIKEDKAPKKVIPIQAADQPRSFYEAHKRVYPRSISGLFMRWRWALVFLTQIIFYGLPWLEWGQRQMVLFDLGARRFYLFGLVLYPQDFIYLAGLLIICALALFLFTAVAGRLWCGFSCPQTVYTEIFMWIEQKVEGERSARIRLDQGGWTFEKIWKKSTKQLLWIVLSVWTGFTFVGYFVPIRELGVELLALQGGWQIFWVLFYGFATYGNAGYMREQVCKYMCPYARFQSAMFDKDTLIVSYDPVRGENRGPRKKNVDYKAQGLGDCIDCKLCVQVCPVGIDIRDGLQYECIGCGLCIDACNSIMDNMHYPRGLIRLTTQNGVAQGWKHAQILRRVLRPRVLIYSGILLALAAAMVVSLSLREPLKVDVIRDRASLARIAAGGKLENVFRLQVMNATETEQTYRVRAHGLEGIAVASETEVVVLPAETRGVAVRVQIPYGSAPAGSHPVYFDIDAVSGQGKVSEKSVFIVPR
ncbi:MULTISPECIES: cytochrome c oxidase accessory protein CcoG [Comamonas]|jgi:cytochrome c oxidase accessory protein FixG|uniref:Cytochrome c oxidase accessory protein CcoG n=1 Tax=Comamonas terrigena TaxID=32013 RepID=A0A2A7UUJ9_COMTR|nr:MULTISPECIES: cytochrome c oxidase accessory protein CcoG [Comamonas]MBD9530183.1 cytochrome c oxidase accessory protein CcoG [Comamonas sp. CMM01]MBV7420283.1 cytochrome c oxidase accessory protein CcoG [Comamonas sp. CMM03]MDH0048861.1 cytochrome c oxidase accessory protein CcoG [Comamonas terrigena]MDH0511786.1 cytochrome c oxidase accessory protein CcoG [Comamonas terrigena]MDH1091117.1 cytochrome c oxidase accessory protein CcoG [Comamonas terrigena]